MYFVSVIEKLELCPIIAAVHEDKFNDALESPAEIIFLLEGDVMTVANVFTSQVKRNMKSVLHVKTVFRLMNLFKKKLSKFAMSWV